MSQSGPTIARFQNLAEDKTRRARSWVSGAVGVFAVTLGVMRHILLTWNPGPRNDKQWSPEQWKTEMVDGTSQGRTLERRWSVGNRIQGIEPGDRAYLLRQGAHGRGLVAIGDITSEPFADDSWREDGGAAQYVDVTWLEAIPLEERVDIDDLKGAMPAFKWDSIYSSGRDITEHGATLEELWFGEASRSVPLPAVVQGAGFGTAEQNRKVEKAAVRHVTDAYEAEGYDVASVEAECCGWDLTATRGDGQVHLEVKGVSSSLVRFFLTANEQRTALADPDWLLIVVTDALDQPGWYELDGQTADRYAEPVLYQVRIPEEAFAD